LLLYPRLHKWRRVTGTVDIGPEDIEEVWSAKQLGLMARSPVTDCEPECPHRRYGIVLPEESLDSVAIPLPLIFAKGATDPGLDHDFIFMRRFISKLVPNAMNELWNLSRHLSAAPMPALKSFTTVVENRLGVRENVSTELFEWLSGINREETGVRTWVAPENVEREMATYLEPWKKLVAERMLDAIARARPR